MKTVLAASAAILSLCSGLEAHAATTLGTMTVTGDDRYPGYLGVYVDGNAYQWNMSGDALGLGQTVSGSYNIEPYWFDASVAANAGVTVTANTTQQLEAPAGATSAQVLGMLVAPSGAYASSYAHSAGDTYYNQNGFKATNGTVYAAPKNAEPQTAWSLETAQSALGLSNKASAELAALYDYTQSQLASYPVTQWSQSQSWSATSTAANPAMNAVLAADQIAGLELIGFSANGPHLEPSYDITLGSKSLSFQGWIDAAYNYAVANANTKVSAVVAVNTGSAGNDFVVGSYTPHVGAVPEPASWALMIVGLGGVGGMLRRRAAPRAVAA